MVCVNGFQCSRNNFWKLLRNPFYCGIIKVPQTKTEEMQLVEAAHEPIIPKDLFDNVQQLIKSRRKQTSVRESLKHLFPLRGFLKCPLCNRNLSGSYSQGRKKKIDIIIVKAADARADSRLIL
jgi:site-specific DNA recombinase